MSFNRADSTQGSIPSVCKHSLHCSVLENYTKFSSSNAATQVSSLPSTVLSDHSSRVFLPFLPFHSNLSETTILLFNSTLNILSVTDVTVITRLVSQPLQLFYLQSRLQVCWSTAWLWPLTSSQRCQAKALQLTIFTIESIDNAYVFILQFIKPKRLLEVERNYRIPRDWRQANI